MKDRRHRRRSIIVWKICVYSAMQNHRSIYNSGMYNHETRLCTQTHKMNEISFPFFAAAHCLVLHLYLTMQDTNLFHSFHLSLILYFSLPPLAAPPSFSPLCPIMDFSCDVRTKYLLLECIDCFNGREQGAKGRGEREDWRHRRVRTESISLIRRASVMHKQKIHTYTHTHVHTRVVHAHAHTRMSDFLCPLIWQVSDNSCHASQCMRKCPHCIFFCAHVMSVHLQCVLIIIWQLNGFYFNDTYEPQSLCKLRAFLLDQGAMKFILNINIISRRYYDSNEADLQDTSLSQWKTGMAASVQI